MRPPQILALGLTLLVLLTFSALAGAQTWTLLNHLPANYVGGPLLLTDGTVIVQEVQSNGDGTGVWYRLTPDNTGSYINGTWTQTAPMPFGYAPLDYASAVLPDGRVIVEGGEYNGSSEDLTALGALYDPVANGWAFVSAPAGFTYNGLPSVGDAPSVVLANGTFMLGNCCGSEDALLNAATLTYTSTASSPYRNNESGWELLPNGMVLAIDPNVPPNYYLYNGSTGQWSSAGSTIVGLGNGCHEIGPAVLRPDGTVFATGGMPQTAIYNSTTGVWSAGPTFPNNFVVADAPAAILPDGNVLVSVGYQNPPPGCSWPQQPADFYEFNGTTLTQVPASPWAGHQMFTGRMLVLPTGQILYTAQNQYPSIYTASGTYKSAWQPTVTSVASTLTVGSFNNVITGTQFNGLSQGAMFGDDAQMATNYPLVRITNSSTGHVFYAKTHNHSTMGVATGSATVSTEFDVPSTIEVGASTLVVVANGIPSATVSVSVSVGAATISTVAGTGTAGYNGDGIQATSAELSPLDVKLDSAGNLYIADQGNQRIRKVKASTGVISTVAGNGTGGYNGDNIPATSAELYYPAGVAVDIAGNIYMADHLNQRIRKVTASTGFISTVTGNGTTGYSGDGGKATSAVLDEPLGLAVDTAGNVYIADTYNHRIRVVNTGTAQITIANTVIPAGDIATVAGDGSGGYNGDNIAATSAELYYPYGVGVDTAGNIYIADSSNYRIRKVTASTGIISTVAGDGSFGHSGDGGPATNATLDFPSDVAADTAGNFYIADRYNSRVRKVTASTGFISTVAGGGTGCAEETDSVGDGCPAISAELNGPYGVAVDSAGNIYIGDAGNSRIRAARQ
jgi:hypothetical protein